ncbi:MAG: DUF1801 domain-containing protein [Pyrinomonadaceae bacterium]|nr:DUF1801 domain-containing protein [Pyrinomonadaceae bacterium]
MAELKTTKTKANVEDFLNEIADENVRADCKKIAVMMEEATQSQPKMWGAAIVGFGSRLVKYESGRELDWMEIGFSPRKQNLTLYLTIGESLDADLLANLGKYKPGKDCLFINRLSDVNGKVLKELIEKTVENIRRK